MKYVVRERRVIVKGRYGITSDQEMELTSRDGRKKYPHRLRRVGFRDKETGKHHVDMTSNYGPSAKTVAEIYKSRWQIELFFKWIKQHRFRQSRMNQIPMASLAATIREPCPFQIPDQLPNLRRRSVVSRPAPSWGHIVEIGAPSAGCAGTRLPRDPSVTGFPSRQSFRRRCPHRRCGTVQENGLRLR